VNFTSDGGGAVVAAAEAGCAESGCGEKVNLKSGGNGEAPNAGLATFCASGGSSGTVLTASICNSRE